MVDDDQVQKLFRFRVEKSEEDNFVIAANIELAIEILDRIQWGKMIDRGEYKEGLSYTIYKEPIDIEG